LGISISACGSSVKKLDILTTPVEKVPLQLPSVTELNLESIEWILVTENNIEEVFKELEKKKYDPVVFGVSDAGYESLSLNLAKIKQLVKQQKAVIIAYQRYYIDQNKNIDESQQKQKEAENSQKNSTSDWWKVWE
jgi:hypothetical protein|tara:strand:+ start:388 stop:795 length:408 start_codon:yes stop_codon:yes gene_type:complete